MDKREKLIQVKVNDREYNYIKEQADSLGLTITTYVRMIALNCNVSISMQDQSSKRQD